MKYLSVVLMMLFLGVIACSTSKKKIEPAGIKEPTISYKVDSDAEKKLEELIKENEIIGEDNEYIIFNDDIYDKKNKSFIEEK